MARRENDTERAVVIAFLRAGHPGLAFGTVLVRSATKLSIFGLLAGGGLLAGRDGAAWVAQVFPTLLP